MTLWVEPSRYLGFLGVALAMCFSPGPANLFSVATGMGRGKRAMAAGVAGMNLANIVWYLAAALGLSALILTFPRVFRLLTLIGAAYLAWLAAKAFVGAWRGEAGIMAGRGSPTNRSAFFDGFIVQASNPKALLFLGAMLPPFLDQGRPLGPQFAVFAATSVSLDGLAMSLYGLTGAALTARMARPAFARAFNLAVGVVLTVVALLVALRG